MELTELPWLVLEEMCFELVEDEFNSS